MDVLSIGRPLDIIVGCPKAALRTALCYMGHEFVGIKIQSRNFPCYGRTCNRIGLINMTIISVFPLTKQNGILKCIVSWVRFRYPF